MMQAPPIAALLPHAGAMVLLERIEAWDEAGIVCTTMSHLDPANPLRCDGRLSTLAGIEYGLQAAAVHGALTLEGLRARRGYLAGLRRVTIAVPRLDEPWIGRLRAIARLQHHEAHGVVYDVELRAEDGRELVAGCATIALPA